MRVFRSLICSGLVGLLVVAAPGCVFDQSIDPAPETLPKITDAEVAPVTAAQLFPLEVRRGTYIASIDRASHAPAAFSLSAIGDGWVWTVEGRTIAHIDVNAEGDFVITSEDDLIEGVKVTYDPALVMLPRELAVGQPHTSRAAMHVTDLDTGASRERGSISSRITLEGVASVTTAAGTFDAYLVRTDWRLNFGVAAASVRVDSAYVLDRGLVWERLRQRLQVLGVAGDVTERLLSLSEEQ